MNEEKLYTLLDNVKRQDLKDLVIVENSLYSINNDDIEHIVYEYQNSVLLNMKLNVLKTFMEVLTDIRNDIMMGNNKYSTLDCEVYYISDLYFKIDDVIDIIEGEE